MGLHEMMHAVSIEQDIQEAVTKFHLLLLIL